MRNFKTENEALEYARNHIGKYRSEKVIVNDKPTFLTSTCLPIEEIFRIPVEETIMDFLKFMGCDDSIEDIAFYIGAQICEEIIEKIEENSNIRVLSTYSDF